MLDSHLLSKPLLIVRRLLRRLWVRVSGMAVLALLTALVTLLFEGYIPAKVSARFTPDAVMPVLTILASGMLAVSTFSLNVMVSAHRAASAQATPRAQRLLLQDTTTQTVLATFIGAFVYSLSAIILFQSHAYADGATVIVLGVTIFVVVLVILAMLRWIEHLSGLGSIDATLRSVEEVAKSALTQFAEAPYFGAVPLTDDTVLPSGALPLRARACGHLQFIDLPQLSKCIANLQGQTGQVYLRCRPGAFVLEGMPLADVAGLTPAQITAAEACFVIGDTRTFEQDACFGLKVLGEVASRALSPGINDPGTAVDVIGRAERLLWNWARNSGETAQAQTRYPTIFVPQLPAEELLSCAFAALARDGAGQIEVALRLQEALAHLCQTPHSDVAEAARALNRTARAYAEAALPIEQDRARIGARSAAEKSASGQRTSGESA
ncbi:MAG: DUF2254 domain-containing protein [Paracoccaceae bacterium]